MRRSPHPRTARPVFIDALSLCGCVTAAAAAANVSRATVYAWKAADPPFAEAWGEALALGLAGMEDRALELAMAGNERLIIFLLSARKPEVYGQRSKVELNQTLTVAQKQTPIDELRAELAALLAPALPADMVSAPVPPELAPLDRR